MNSNYFQKNKYLLNCDFVNKYGIKSSYRIPYVEKMTISFSSSDLLSKESDFSKFNPVKGFSLFYLMFSSLSYIQIFNKKKLADNNIVDRQFEFRMTLKNKKIIDSFLLNFIGNKASLLEKSKISMDVMNNLTYNRKNFYPFYSEKTDSLLKSYSTTNFKLNFNFKYFSNDIPKKHTLSNIVILN